MNAATLSPLATEADNTNFNLSEANWIAFRSSISNQWLLDDSMWLQLVHTVQHSYN